MYKLYLYNFNLLIVNCLYLSLNIVIFITLYSVCIKLYQNHVQNKISWASTQARSVGLIILFKNFKINIKIK